MAELLNKITETELEQALAAKANKAHGHVISDVAGLQAMLDGFTIEDIAGLKAALDSKLDGDADLDSLVLDHGAMQGLGDDDHPHYLNETRGTALFYLKATVDAMLATKLDVDTEFAINDIDGLVNALGAKLDADTRFSLETIEGLSDALDAKMDADAALDGIITNHGALSGLSGDDHPQYLTAGRGDARYSLKANRIRITADHQAVNEQRISVTTQAGPVTISAPVAPDEGTYFRVSDAGANAATHPITIDFGGHSFNGGPDSAFVIDINGLSFGFIFTASTWEVFD